jgi:Tfp pilus assembly PilM family ATPase
LVSFRRTGWIGVDIGTHAVKLAQVERAGGGLRLRQAMLIARTTPWNNSDAAQAIPAPSTDEILAAMSLGEAFRGRSAACSLPMHLCQVRTLEISPGNEGTRHAAVASALETIARNDQRDREFDFWDIELPGEGRRASRENVCLLSIAGAWTVQAAGDVSRAGLSCEVLDGIPLALARAVEMSPLARSGEMIAAVDWGFTSATLCVVFQGRPLYVRSLPGCGLRNIVEPICAALSVSADEAQVLLRKHGLPAGSDQPQRGDELSNVLADVAAKPLAGFVDEINRTLSYLCNQRPQIEPQRICLFGGGATIRHVDRWLAVKMKLGVHVWEMPQAAPSSAAAEFPLPLLGPAIALSSLAWMKS